MKKNSENLINELVSDLKPVKLVKFRFIHLAKVIVSGFLCLFSAVAITGLRIDIEAQVLNAKFILDTVLLIFLGLLSIIAAFVLSVPSVKKGNIYLLPGFVFGLILLASGYSFLTTSNPLLYLGHGFACVFEILSISILPATLLFYFVRRAAVLRRDIVGILVLLSGLSFGLLGAQFTCMDSTPMHMLLWHIIPTGVFMSFGIWLSRLILKKI